MEINFELNTYVRSDGRQQIMLRYAFACERVRFGTGCKILAKKWDKKRKQVKALPNGEHHYINDILRSMESEVREIVYYIKSQKNEPPYCQAVKEIYKKRQRVERGLDFWGYYDRFIKESTPSWKQSTIRVNKGAYDRLLEFEKEAKYLLAFPRMGKSFQTKFRNYCIEQGLGEATVIVYLTKIKSFLKYADSSGWTDKDYTKGWNLGSTKSKGTEPISKELFLKLISYDGKDKPVVDRFLFHCFTGLRFSDAKNGNYEIVKGEIPYIKFLNNKKSKNKIGPIYSEIPLIPHALDIIERYSGIPQYQLQIFNNSIRDIIRKIGYPEVQPTSHAARKTMASYLEGMGASDRIIKKALTHSGGLIDVYAKGDMSTLYDFLIKAFSFALKL